MDMQRAFRLSLVAAALASLGGVAMAQGAIDGSNAVAQPAVSRTGTVIRAEAAPRLETVAAKSTSEASTSASTSEMAAMTSEARTPASAGFVTDTQGSVVRSWNGDCVVSGTGGGEAAGVPACGGLVAQAMPAAPIAEAAPQPAPLRRVSLDADTTFSFDSAELTNEGRDQLASIVEAGTKENVDRLRVHITGYADRIGAEDYNRSLSEQRAETVRQFFVDNGLPAEVITAEGRGEMNPVVQCEGMTGVSLVECLRPNRRSEVEFAALERAPDQSSEQQPWAPATDTGTPR